MYLNIPEFNHFKILKMATLSAVWLKKSDMELMVKKCLATDAKGIELTIAVNDECSNYQQNVKGFVSQSKEDREAGKNKYYVLNGRTYWSDGVATPAFDKYGKPLDGKNPPSAATPANLEGIEGDGLPF